MDLFSGGKASALPFRILPPESFETGPQDMLAHADAGIVVKQASGFGMRCITWTARQWNSSGDSGNCASYNSKDDAVAVEISTPARLPQSIPSSTHMGACKVPAEAA